MNRQILQYKITITGPGNDVEIRYLAIESILYHNYNYFIRKLIAAFPKLKDHPFTVNWKDKEGDVIRLGSDDELTIALDEMKSDPLKKIFIIVKQQGSDIMLHPDIVCDGCDLSIKGFRYKCLICDDYELCSVCERSQIHPDHPVIRIPKPLIPDTSYGKQFAKDMPKISEHLERLFQQTGDDISQSSEQKSSTVVSKSSEQKNSCDVSQSSNQNSPTGNKQKLIKFCHNDCHNILGTLIFEKLMKNYIAQQRCQQDVNSIQSEPAASADVPIRKESENVNILTNELSSLSVDDSGDIRREDGPPIHKDEALKQQVDPLQTVNGERMIAFTDSSPAASTITEVLPIESNSKRSQIMSEIDAAPTPVDPTPVLKAQVTPPRSHFSDTQSSEPEIQARSVAISFPDSPNPSPSVDDGSLDTSWTVVKNERTISGSSSDSIELIESPEQSAPSTPKQTDSPPAQEIGKKHRLFHRLA